MDHDKPHYFPDLKKLEEWGCLRKGSVVVGDNMIRPGAPDYVQYFRESADYDSIYYYSFLEYCRIPDAVMVSERLID